MNFFLTCKRWTKGKNFSKQWYNFAHYNQTKSSLHYTLYLTGRGTDVHLFARSAAAEHLTFSIEYFKYPFPALSACILCLWDTEVISEKASSAHCERLLSIKVHLTHPTLRSHSFRVPPFLLHWSAASSLHCLIMQTQTPDGNINS